MRDPPTGTVTFLFADIEGSTRLLQRLRDRYREVVNGHGRILRQAIALGGGTEIHTEGDAFTMATRRLGSPRGRQAATPVNSVYRAEIYPWNDA